MLKALEVYGYTALLVFRVMPEEGAILDALEAAPYN